MKAIEILYEEHQLIESLLACLKAVIKEARSQGRVDKIRTQELLCLFEYFADGSHQEKEEMHLFPQLIERATHEERKRLARLLSQHTEERRRLIGMRLFLEGACDGDEASVHSFVINALIYARLQRDHIAQENEFLLPLAEAILSPADDRRLVIWFQNIDARFGIDGSPQAQVAALFRRFVDDGPVVEVRSGPMSGGGPREQETLLFY